jgi:serine/threonine-protein kinase
MPGSDLLEELAVKRGLLTREQLQEAHTQQIHSSESIADVLVRTGRLTPEQVEELRALMSVVKKAVGAAAPPPPSPAKPASPVQDQRPPTERTPARRPTFDPTLPEEVAIAAQNRDNIIGKFVLVRLLGRGGMGEVFKAWEKTLRRYVAIKFILADTEEDRKRFFREAQTAAKLEHENIAPVYEVGVVGGGKRPFIVMKYIEGVMLGHAKLTLRQKVRAMRDAARAIEYAHQKGVIHRDLKPSNVMIEPLAREGSSVGRRDPKDGAFKVYVMDFGLAREINIKSSLSADGMVIGTPQYMAPEQALGHSKDVDAQSDVYALGSTLYELVTDEPPFTGNNPYNILCQVVEKEPRAPRSINRALPVELETIILKCLEKDKERRYASAAELADELDRYLEGEPILAKPAGVVTRVYKRVRKHPLAYALSATTVLAVLAAVFITVFLSGRTASLETDRQTALTEKKQAQEKLAKERDEAVALMRQAANVSLQAALQLRRSGKNQEMRQFLMPLQSSYEAALKRAPDLAELDYLMGRMHRLLLDDARALEFQNQALKKEPGFLPALYERVVLQSKKYGGDSRRAYHLLFASRGHDEPAMTIHDVEQARPELTLLRQSILEDLKRIEAAALTKPSDAYTTSRSHAAGGIISYHTGFFQAALSQLHEAVAENPDLEEAWETMAAIAESQALLAEMLEEKLTHWKSAEEFCSKGVERDGGYVPHLVTRSRIRIDRAKALVRAGQDPLADWSVAEQDLARVLQFGGPQAEIFIKLGDLRNDRALYLQSRRNDPSSDWDAAIKSFSRAIELDPVNANAFCGRGSVRLNQGIRRMDRNEDPKDDFAAAESDYTRALAIDKTFFVAWMGRGSIQRNRGVIIDRQGGDPREAYVAAEKDLTQALEIRDRHMDARLRRAQLRLNLAISSIRLNESGELPLSAAKEDLDQIIHMGRAPVLAWHLRGDTRWIQAQSAEGRGEGGQAQLHYSAAADDYEHAVSLDPQLGSKLESRIRAARAKGRSSNDD